MIQPFHIFLVFLRLGCISFGGPVAHLGYFREEFVSRRAWLSDSEFAELVAIAQTLPGPASSQTGFAIGLLKGGWPGGLAAWAGFMLPSALLMFGFAYAQSSLHTPLFGGMLHGLRLVAVAVVAQAVLLMQPSLAADRARVAVALAAAGLTLVFAAPFNTLAAIATGALCGLFLPYQNTGVGSSHRLRGSGVCLILFALLFAAGLFPNRLAALFDCFYRSGALVFGGGHVVLPLLQSTVVANGWVNEETFLAGYGAAQAIPGPLFTFSAFLGAVAAGPPERSSLCLASSLPAFC